MISELLDWLLRASLVVTLLSLLVLALRTPLRRWFGASIGYALWIVIPLSLVVVSVPSTQPEPYRIPLVTQPITEYMTHQLSTRPAGKKFYTSAIAYGWLAGGLVLALWLLMQQQFFLRKLGRLEFKNGVYMTTSNHLGPFLLGCWQPRIIVPNDFFQRFSPQQQQLIIAHEQEHARRKDPLCNLLCAAIQILFWFNPVIYLATRQYRTDQELSCDLRVLKKYPDSQRLYAETLLANRLNHIIYPMACSITPYQNTRERIMNIHQTQKSIHTLLLGKLFILIVLIAGGIGARAVSPTIHDSLPVQNQEAASEARMFKVSFDMAIDGVNSQPVLISRENTQTGIVIAGETAEWKIDYTLESVDIGKEGMFAMMNLNILRDRESISQPALLVKIDEPTTILMNHEQTSSPEISISMQPSLY